MGIQENCYIVLQAYGSKDILNECVFALLSLSNRHSAEELASIEICIYTDQAAYFRSFNISALRIAYREVNQQLISSWRGAINFVHRVKIEVLRDFAKQHSGQILYLDTDVCFAQSLTEIFRNIGSGKLYMHIMEGAVHHSDNVVFNKLSKFLGRENIVVDDRAIVIPDEVKMWNAGVLGFHTKYAYLLDEILQFTDLVYNRFPKHVVEQFAFSLYFQQTAPLFTAHTHIYHYWNLKELRPVLDSFLTFFQTKNWEQMARVSTLIQLPDYMQQKANFYYNRSTVDKLLKKKWLPKIPNWNLLVQQL